MRTTECLAIAKAIAQDLSAIDYDDGSLRGSAAVLVVFHELRDDAPRVARSLRNRWEAATIASLETLEASFFDGVLGAAWALARTGVACRAELDGVDAAVLDVLAGAWDTGLAPFNGGLAGFGLYGLARMRTHLGRQIVERCIDLFVELAHHDRDAVWWSPVLQGPFGLHNMEGSAAAISFLAAAARAGSGDRALPLARAGARTLATRIQAAHERRLGEHIGVAVTRTSPGLVHGQGTWALGTAGPVSAFLGVALASPPELELATQLGRQLADLDPDHCEAIDCSLGSGSAGIACVMRSLARATDARVFRHAADYWTLQIVRARVSGNGPGGYTYLDPLCDASEGGSRWAPRVGLFEGAAGTALALLAATRRVPSIDWCAGAV